MRLTLRSLRIPLTAIVNNTVATAYRMNAMKSKRLLH